MSEVNQNKETGRTIASLLLGASIALSGGAGGVGWLLGLTVAQAIVVSISAFLLTYAAVAATLVVLMLVALGLADE